MFFLTEYLTLFVRIVFVYKWGNTTCRSPKLDFQTLQLSHMSLSPPAILHCPPSAPVTAPNNPLRGGASHRAQPITQERTGTFVMPRQSESGGKSCLMFIRGRMEAELSCSTGRVWSFNGFLAEFNEVPDSRHVRRKLLMTKLLRYWK